jgi:hypothetical protein
VRKGHGLSSQSARTVIEDSAFWSNANRGISFQLGSGYAVAPSEVSGTSVWGNRDFGI